ncbi:septum formation family protein [Georgenia alba]|uniref:Septum formation family protein n=1 Tax=Georgenia alba TaxID=2233858 RepID=A0ABW2QCF7_9MICO
MRKAVLSAVAVTALVAPLAACSSGNVFELQEGDCLNRSDFEGGEVTDVEILECGEQHDAEVFALVEHTGEEFPGDQAIQDEAGTMCEPPFEEFIGVPYAESELFFSVLTPSEESWNQADDRTSACIVTVDEPMTGSLEGANR